LAIVENDLRASHPVTLSDIGNVRKELIYQEIFTAQCASRAVDPKTGAPVAGTGVPNPLIPVITGPVSIALQGSIQQAGGLTVTGSATPSGALSYTVTQGQQQQVTVPVTFVSARGLPNFYMGQNLANLTNLSEGADKKHIVAEIIGNRTALSTLVEAAIKAYPGDDSQCPKDVTDVAPVAPQLE
jgi:hypothetical protein